MSNNGNPPVGIDYDYSTGMPLTSNAFPTGHSAGQFLTSDSNGFQWSSPSMKYGEASGGVPIMVQAELRNQHPALQEAWEKYLTILHLCNDKS